MKPETNVPAVTPRQSTPCPRPTIAEVCATIESGAPFLFPHEVEAYLRVSDTTIWRQERLGKFPRRIHLAPKRVAWRTPDIVAFVAGAWKGENAPEPRNAAAA